MSWSGSELGTVESIAMEGEKVTVSIRPTDGGNKLTLDEWGEIIRTAVSKAISRYVERLP